MDDSTCYEKSLSLAQVRCNEHWTNVSEWPKKNDMNLNKLKTKFMEIKFSLSGSVHPLVLEGEIIEKVNNVKLLGIHIQDDLK